jgi:hypothetical protein
MDDMSDNVIKFKRPTPKKPDKQPNPSRPPRQTPPGRRKLLVIAAIVVGIGAVYTYYALTLTQ